MLNKFTTRALAVFLACVFAACWSEISAQVQSPVENGAIGANAASSEPIDKGTDAEIASTSAPVSTVAAPTPEPVKSPSAELPSATPAADPVALPMPDAKVRKDMSPQTTPKDKPDESYVVGIADELQISVWKEPDLSGPVVVRPDGMITLPVVDDVAVVGLTTKQVQDVLTEKLKPVVAEPQVTVIVRNIRSRKVYLVGQVGHPGAVSLNGHETVLQILAESGGPSLYAKSDKIYILRQAGGRQERLNFNYKKALKGVDTHADFPLESGDVIVVP